MTALLVVAALAGYVTVAAAFGRLLARLQAARTAERADTDRWVAQLQAMREEQS